MSYRLNEVITDGVESCGWDDRDATWSERATNGIVWPAGRVHHCPAPETAPVLEPKHRAARLVTNGTLGGDGQIAFHPLMWHGNILRHQFLIIVLTQLHHVSRSSLWFHYPFFIFDDVLAYRGQGGPFAVIDGLNGASFVGLELAHFARETVRRDARQGLAAHVAIGWFCMARCIPEIEVGRKMIPPSRSARAIPNRYTQCMLTQQPLRRPNKRRSKY